MSATRVLELARQRGVIIATAESCTGGLIAGALTDIPGSSDVFDRGFVTYSNDAKIDMLGVPRDLIEAHGAVSEHVARAMATGALTHSNAAMAVSVTGVAGPGASERKPEGLVCFAVAERKRSPQVETMQFGAIGRTHVRQASVAHALDLLIRTLSQRD